MVSHALSRADLTSVSRFAALSSPGTFHSLPFSLLALRSSFGQDAASKARVTAMEVYVTVSKIVSAFQKSADALQAIQDRKEKKKRKKEKDFEELVEGRMLHKSLIEGRDQCQKIVSDRHQQYGMPFDLGDVPATCALKDVVISLQGDIMQALQMALLNESLTVNIGQLLELSITNRQAAIRAMDELCQRLTATAPAQRPYVDDGYDARPSPFMSPVSPNVGQVHPQMYRTRSNDSAESLPMASTASSYQAAQYPPPLSFQRMQSVRQPNEVLPSRHMSHVSHGSPYSDWSGQRYRSPEIEADLRRRMVREEDEDAAEVSLSVRGRERPNVPSMHDSAIGSVAGSRHKPSNSFNSNFIPESKGGSPFKEQSEFDTSEDAKGEVPANRVAPVTSTNRPENQAGQIQDQASNRTTSITSSAPHSPMPPQTRLRTDGGISSDSEDASSFSSHTRAASQTASSIRTETAEDRARAMYAPEVVTKEFESMLLQPGRPSLQGQQTPSQADIHPALREPFQMPILPPSAGIAQPWLPLPRPARHNNYHGFCKGAWQIRKNIREGLSIRMIPNANGVEVPHWKCKLCEYRSKGVSLQSANVLPDEV